MLKSARRRCPKKKTMPGKLLYSPADMNKAFSSGLKTRGWAQRKNGFWVAPDEKLMRRIYYLPAEIQKERIQEEGYTPIYSYNQTDFVKDRVAVEVQFGKYSFVAHDLFVKHLSFFVAEEIDVGIEVLPMKSLREKCPQESPIMRGLNERDTSGARSTGSAFGFGRYCPLIAGRGFQSSIGIVCTSLFLPATGLCLPFLTS